MRKKGRSIKDTRMHLLFATIIPIMRRSFALDSFHGNVRCWRRQKPRKRKCERGKEKSARINWVARSGHCVLYHLLTSLMLPPICWNHDHHLSDHHQHHHAAPHKCTAGWARDNRPNGRGVPHVRLVST